MPQDRNDTSLTHIRQVARILDDSIPVPGTSYRIGLDALIGLIPGIGDLIGTALSAYIIVKAAALGVSAATLFRMILNVAVEGVAGSVPLAGDVFDAVWKANMRNVGLIEREMGSGRALVSSKVVLVGVVAALAFVFVLIVSLVVLVLNGAYEVLVNVFS